MSPERRHDLNLILDRTFGSLGDFRVVGRREDFKCLTWKKAVNAGGAEHENGKGGATIVRTRV